LADHPRDAAQLMGDADPAKAGRVVQTVMPTGKIDFAGMQ